MSKPTNKPGWTATTNPSLEPTSKKLIGWSAGEKPSAEHMNWLFKTVSDWVNYIDVTPIGSGSLSVEDKTRIAVLEEKAKILAPVSVEMPLSFQGTGISSEYNAGNSGASKTIDWSNGTSQSLTLDSNTQISFLNAVPNKVYYLRLIQTDALKKSISWLNSVNWMSGFESQSSNGQTIYDQITSPSFISSSSASVILKTNDGNYVGWGLNGVGELGNNSKTVNTIPDYLSYGINFSTIKGAPFYYSNQGTTVGLDTNGYAYGWGRNYYGEVGDGTNTERLTPTPALGNRQYDFISTGMCTNGSNSSSFFVLAIEKNTGNLYSWGTGDNYTGALGRGINVVNNKTPGLVSGNLTWKKAHAGGRSAGITTSGAIYTWGGGTGASLATAAANIPTLFDNSKNYSEITGTSNLLSNADLALFAMDSDGIIYSWNPSGGTNASGILGSGTTTTRTTIAPISGNRFYSKMACGRNHVAAIEVGTNKLYAWGNNQYGQVGDGTTVNKSSPTLIAGDKQFTNVVCGDGFTIAVEKDTGDIYVWGQGANYRLGTGSTGNVLVPTKLAVQSSTEQSSTESSKLISLYYNGSSYVGQVVDGFRIPQSGPETKSGYVAGGFSGGTNGGADLQSVEKIDFNSNGVSSIVSVVFGSEISSTGGTPAGGTSGAQIGYGTQSSTHGYRTMRVYVTGALPTVNGQSSRTVSKFSFSNNTTTTLRPANTTTWFNILRNAIVQSETDAYVHRSTTTLAKLTFSTDLFSTVTGTYTIMGTPTGYSVGFSSPTTAWFAFTNGSVAGKQTEIYKMQFATETQVSLATNWSYTNSIDRGGYGETIDTNEAGYWQRGNSANQSIVYKLNKTTDTWSGLTSLSGISTAAAGVQGSSSGYFCGGQMTDTGAAPSSSSIAFSTIKRMDFSTEAYVTNSESLKQARHFASGFEG